MTPLVNQDTEISSATDEQLGPPNVDKILVHTRKFGIRRMAHFPTMLLSGWLVPQKDTVLVPISNLTQEQSRTKFPKLSHFRNSQLLNASFRGSPCRPHSNQSLNLQPLLCPRRAGDLVFCCRHLP